MAALIKLCLTSAVVLASFEATAQPTQFDCGSFADLARVGPDDGLSLVQGFIEEHSEAGFSFDIECINQAVKRNYIEATELMISEYFSKEPQRASQAESTARNTIDQVRNRQNELLLRFEQIPKSIPVISPAFNWAQSLNTTMLEVKYSTRFDSPACLDIFDQEFRIENEGKRLYLKAMCRNDKKLLKYELALDLWEEVLPEPDSYLEESSVGRVFINLAKAEEPSKWKKLLASGKPKPGNMGVWWELWEKHEKDLNKHAGDDDDDDDDDDEVVSDSSQQGEGASAENDEPSGKKQRGKSQKSNKRGKKKEKKAKKSEDEQKSSGGEGGNNAASEEL